MSLGLGAEICYNDFDFLMDGIYTGINKGDSTYGESICYYSDVQQ